jgi:hypothetical protein
MAILISEMLNTSKVTDLSTENIKKWLAVQAEKICIETLMSSRQVIIKISVESIERERKGKGKDFLKERFKGKNITDKEGVWVQGDYAFYFIENVYKWKGEAVHLSANEAAYLYKCLMLKENGKPCWYYMRNIRSRLGKEFLREVDLC